MIEPDHEELSVREQCELLRLHRSTLYYQPRPVPQENEALMRRMDELHTAHITRGSRKIRDALRLEGWKVNRKRVQRLMRHMALRVVFPQAVSPSAATGSRSLSVSPSWNVGHPTEPGLVD